MEALARNYFSLGNVVKQQLGPTKEADLRRELSDDFEFVAPLVGPLNKDAIVAATTGLDLGAGLPDFDARYAWIRQPQSGDGFVPLAPRFLVARC